MMSNPDSLRAEEATAITLINLHRLRTWPVGDLGRWAADKIEHLSRELAQAKTQRYPHWTCKTHGDFDARVAVSRPTS